MKKILTLILSFGALITACKSNDSKASESGSYSSATSTANLSATASSDKGTITCNLDGTPKTFHVSQSFFEISFDVDRTGAKDGIEILDGSSKKEGFQFEIKKSGTTKIKGNGTGDLLCVINYYNPQGVTYTGKDVMIEVTSYNQQHLTGTFSGTLDNVYYDLGTNGAKNYPQSIQITDGKFDLHK